MKYLIFDLRGEFDLDEALILSTADTLEEAREDAQDQGGGVIVNCDHPEDYNITEKDIVEVVRT